ncbi:hypothetical protein Tco_0415495 [Tanacetum coccineum]
MVVEGTHNYCTLRWGEWVTGGVENTDGAICTQWYNGKRSSNGVILTGSARGGDETGGDLANTSGDRGWMGKRGFLNHLVGSRLVGLECRMLVGFCGGVLDIFRESHSDGQTGSYLNIILKVRGGYKSYTETRRLVFRAMRRR